MEQIIVIGGGASGMMAALSAARKGAKVLILERNSKMGKKILATGNGKCNFTNINQSPACYRGEHPEFAWEAVCSFPVSDTIRFFLEAGLYSKNRNGYLYPNSEQAQAVRDILQMELERLQVRVETDTDVREIKKEKEGFLISGVRQILTPKKQSKKRIVFVKTGEEKKQWHTRKVILATGGMAFSSSGSDGTGIKLAKRLGHTIVPCVPALVQLHCRETFYSLLAGVRVTAKVELLIDEVTEAMDTGEIQFTNYGISGIPVFQVSRYAAKALETGKKKIRAEIDFMPDFTKEQLENFLENRKKQHPEKTMSDYFTGLFHDKIANVLLERADIPKDLPAGKLSQKQKESLCKQIKSFSTEIIDTNGFEQAQVSAGGVSTEEIDVHTMESRKIPGLYFAGEVMDVDGMCGGYNLQWAWSSGFLAGSHAAGKEER
nr:NAD(P)/FAD-dependent oxidoreductase [uncultured Sellimonas sp.]